MAMVTTKPTDSPMDKVGTSELLVSLEDVGKVYPNGTVAVQNANLEAGEGEFLCFVGPSGCGKSTIFNMIAGLTGPTSGRLSVLQTTPKEARKQNEIFLRFSGTHAFAMGEID